MLFYILRGFGYFIGIDLVKNRQTREPATASATTVLKQWGAFLGFYFEFISNISYFLSMKDNKILLSLDGPYSNVMKIKPPLCFNKENATAIVQTLDKVLTDLKVRAHI